MLTLIVPGLIWTRQALADLTCDLPLPAFTTLLGRGRLRHLPPRNTAAAMSEIAGLTGPIPAAALRWLALRGHPGNEEWLCLDPVRLRFENRALVIDDPQHLALGDDESATLAAALAPTFADLGQLEIASPRFWNLRLLFGAPAFQPLPEAAGRSAAPLPLDASYAPWRHAINEAQIILHSHPVNQARTAAGLPVVNSLWPWGGGRLPESTPRAHAAPSRAGTAAHDALWSDDPVDRGIARLLRADAAPLPAAFTNAATASRPLAVISALDHSARTGDSIAWRDELARFDTDWLAPILTALRGGRLDALRLIAPGELGAAELQISHRDLWKFWRKPLTLAELVAP